MVRRMVFLVAVLLALPAGASAWSVRANFAKRAGLSMAPLTGVPAAASPGASLVVKGAVRATKRTARKVKLVAILRDGVQRDVLALKTLRRVKPGAPRRYALDVVVPTRGVSAGAHKLRVCAQSRNRRSRCASRPISINPPIGYGTPTPTPSASAAPTATTTATPTATASATATASPTVSPTTSPTATASPTTTASPTATATASPTASPTATATATATPPGAGAETVGDSLFPNLGNGGYDAQGYDLALNYTPVPFTAGTLSGSTTMTAKATQALSRFSLDLQGFTVTAVTVNGAPASAFTRFDGGNGALDAHKLRVTPAAPIASGATFAVKVTYSGAPPTITDPDGSDEGFLPTSDGAFVVGEPMGSMGWFPNNNHPSDKATFRMSMTVPENVEVIGNGVLESNTTSGMSRTWIWNETHPMSTYLSTATLGQFTIATRNAAGLDYYDAKDITAVNTPAGIAPEPAMIALYTNRYGAYPFSIAGSIVDLAPNVGYALETQTKPVYPSVAAASVGTVSHELAHQYFGDSVTLARWRDIWLNEGFAEFTSFLYGESTGGTTTAARFNSIYNSSSMTWNIPPANPPTAADIFDTDAMYNRGAATLCALRTITGDTEFFSIMSTWATDHKYGNVTTEQFLALVKQISSKPDERLDQFFQDWLYDADKPTITPTTF